MSPLQFQPLISQPTPEFWSALTALKLDKLRLDDSIIPLHAWVDEGREVANTNRMTGQVDDNVGVDGSVFLPASAFEDSGKQLPVTSTVMHGLFKNYNTIEQFRSPQEKKQVFDSVVQQMVASFDDDQPLLNTFILFAFADLKKYSYHYWFAFPAFVAKPSWQLDSDFTQAPAQDVEEIRQLIAERGVSATGLTSVLLFKGPPGSRSSAPLSKASTFFAGVPAAERLLAFHDPSSLPNNPGWPLRNILFYLQTHHSVLNVAVICLRQGDTSRFGRLSAQAAAPSEGKPQAVGWERDGSGKLASRVANLGPMLNPTRLAEQAVDLNLKLMRWRILPDLDLDRIASTKCLLLGAGTLGCYVARALMGWGIRTITFVDSARVSYSNPARQPLFQFEDCLNGGKPKAECAAQRLKEVFPSINATGHSMMIPMPGHPIGQGSEEETAGMVAKLEDLIREHDAVFLLMDSRESRWLPTVMGATLNKIVINAALGFDSYLVMRHGAGPLDSQTKRLGCYFCNDIVAPADSLTDRTLDQMCTVTRPGVAPIAAASAVELLVSLVQHPLGGFGFLLRAFNDTGFLEGLTGLDKLYAEAEAVLDNVDWEEDSDDGGL
ncbi:Autophagy- protein 7 (Autophagy- E1-like activating enzyme atg7) [Apiotrichum porosum]|uniref:Ubiquitin-like modifier-activating enzyme ATG7 n=1 Tax=Apiotrichum porosum TaxID=105984 RepID=A0A427YB24_9TREE|nr:Autophagy- protein 7 (Autophagy- E1-like activating enzyme atg7) [Apiotrichum porosum]RSH88204.1 Autophagy- protein 7 (Autophagy- E1-like activating enzyme atg7) [Apiotrichum porosum]